MRQKSGEGEAIMRPLEKIQRLCDMKVKKLHTDGAREQYAEKLRHFLASNDMTAAHTAPNASQSNYFTERHFRIFMEPTRTAMATAPYMPKNCLSYAVL